MDPARLHRILRQHVQTDRLLGVDAVPVASSRPSLAAAATTQAERAVKAAEVNPSAHAVTDSADASTSAAPSRVALLDRAQKLHVLDQMDRTEVRGCTDCVLHESRTQTVFGEGNPDARVMIVGEGPGREEDRTGRPFVGRSGELLDKQIQAMGFTREQVYIANVVKCRPPDNRTPTPEEADTCGGNYLRRQIETIRPAVILTLGGPAAKLLLGPSGATAGITRLRGNWHAYTAVDPPIPVMPTFHPAYLLRQYTKENRARVWNDLQAVMSKLDEFNESNAQ